MNEELIKYNAEKIGTLQNLQYNLRNAPPDILTHESILHSIIRILLDDAKQLHKELTLKNDR